MYAEEEDKQSSDEDEETLALQEHEEEKLESNEDYTNMDIMALLDQKKLSNIKRDFKHMSDEGLFIQEFVNIMLHHLPETRNKTRLVGSLIELFAQIDVNGDNRLEWEEFSNHIIELGMIRKDRTFLDAIKEYKHLEWKDEAKHDSEVEHMYYLPKLKHLLVMERESRFFNVYDMKTGRRKDQVGGPDGHKGAVIGWAHAKQFGQVATSSNDLTINLWDETTYKIKQRISTPDIQLVLAWASQHQVLYGGGADAVIYTWNLSEQRGMKAIEGLNPFKRGEQAAQEGHSGPITALLPIKKHNILVSAGMDGRIFLWDMPQNSFRKEMDTPKQYKKGIYSLDWNGEQNCIFSAGLDHDAYVWNPYVARHIYQLKGHIHSLVGIKCIPHTPQIITADISGMFKIWDIRTHTQIQTFNIPTSDLNCFAVSYPEYGSKAVEKRVIAGAKRIWQYKYDEPKDQHLADEGMSICTIYNTAFNSFISAHPKSIKIWNAVNGEIQHIFREPSKAEVTCMILHNRKRKLYVGDSAGKVFTLNIKNGTKIKKFRSHTDEVTSLYYWEGSEDVKLLISSSWDGSVIVHDDSKSDPVGIVRYNKIRHKGSANSVSFKENDGIVASCSDDQTIILTNLNTYRQEASALHHEAEVKNLLFLNPHDCLASCDLAGKLYFWATTPSRIRNTLLLEVYNIVISSTGEDDYCPIRALVFYQQEDILFTADDNGNIRKWLVAPLLQKLAAQGTIATKMVPDSEETKRDKSGSAGTFLTSTNIGMHGQDIDITTKDVSLIYEWKAHKDSINHLLYVENPECLVSSSFDCNIHIWNLYGQKLGSLVLGNDPSKWHIHPDIQAAVDDAKQAAFKIIDEVNHQSYEDLIQEYGNRRVDEESDDDDIPDVSKKEDDIIEKTKQHLKKQAEERVGKLKIKKQRPEGVPSTQRSNRSGGTLDFAAKVRQERGDMRD